MCEKCFGLHTKATCSRCWNRVWMRKCFRCKDKVAVKDQKYGRFCKNCYYALNDGFADAELEAESKLFLEKRNTDPLPRATNLLCNCYSFRKRKLYRPIARRQPICHPVIVDYAFIPFQLRLRSLLRRERQRLKVTMQRRALAFQRKLATSRS